MEWRSFMIQIKNLKKSKPETVVWQSIETDYWISYLEELIIEHNKETDSNFSKNILKILRRRLRILFNMSKGNDSKIKKPIGFKN